MDNIIELIEIDRRLYDYLNRKPIGSQVGVVHSVFDKVINIFSEDEEILYSLAIDAVIQSPMMMRTKDNNMFLKIKSKVKQSKEIFLVDYGIVKIGNTFCDFSNAMKWERDIHSLSHNHYNTYKDDFEKLNSHLKLEGVDSGLLSAWARLIDGALLNEAKDKTIYIEPFYKNLVVLEKITKQKNHLELFSTSLNLVGLGVGLTPSGDDFLLGYLATLQYLRSPMFKIFQEKKDEWLSYVKKQTTAISYFMLENGMNGSINNALFALMADISLHQPVVHSFKNILSIGSTSGTDMAIGVSFAFRQYQNNRGG